MRFGSDRGMKIDQGQHIVVVGAALGGVTGMVKIAKDWPCELPATVLVALAAQSMPPTSVLEMLRGYSPVSVTYPEPDEILEPRRIYLSPPHRHLSVGAGGLLKVVEGSAFDGAGPSINRLFASAAAVYGRRVIGIILSGDTRDGAQGMLEIEAAGGVGIVQTPEDAAEPRMPLHTVQHGRPRYCVSAAEIAPLVRMLMCNARKAAGLAAH
jgi:two-component system, chemotaxis family, protein-glutamate methylesterase/glutaminase